MGYKFILNFYIKHAKKYRWFYLVIFSSTLLESISPLWYSYVVKLLIDIFNTVQDVTYSDVSSVLYLYIALILGQNIISAASFYAQWRVLPYVHRNIIVDLYDIIQHRSYKFFQENSTGFIVSKVKDVIDHYRCIIEDLHHGIGADILTVLVNISWMFFVNFYLGFSLLVLAIVMFIVIRRCALNAEQRVFIARHTLHKLFGGVTDRLLNILSIFAFSTFKKEREGLHKEFNNSVIPTQEKVYKSEFILLQLSNILYIGVIIVVIGNIILLRQKGLLTVGDVAMVLSMALAIAEGLWDIGMSLTEFINNIGELRSAFNIVIDEKEKFNVGKEIDATNCDIEFRNVSFKYEDTYIFKDFNFKIKAGEHVGVIGESGVGKSSMLSLLLKHIDCNVGNIYIGDTSIKDITFKSLHDNISLISQDTILFNRSLMDNLKYAKCDTPDEEVIEICKNVNLHNIIMNMPDQYNTLVGERGTKLSGGQRQRISIVRALIRRTPILLLDEATSALDVDTEYEVQAVLKKYFSNTTMIFISHKLSVLKDMDRIVVLKDGQIIEEGSHQKLYNDTNSYYRIHYT